MQQPLPDIACDICGTFFTPTTKRNILCPDCRKHPELKRKQLEKQIIQSKIRYDQKIPQLQTKICIVCGNEFHTYKNEHTCSQECQDKYRIQNTVCKNCKKPMTETNDQRVTKNNENWFCCDTCKQEYRIKQAKEKGHFHVCKYCNKEFIRSDEYAEFCSKTCYKKATKSGYERTFVCINCHKQFKSTKRTDFCSETCDSMHYQKNRRQKPTDAYIKKHTKTKPEKTKTAPVSLCADCCTSYKDCDYMASNFTIKPKGAKYENSIIVECPKYKPPKQKIRIQEEHNDPKRRNCNGI